MKKGKQGTLIAFEGIDGSGKTTISRAVAQALQSTFDILLTKEPGDSALGAHIRSIIMNKDIAICPQAEFLLFAADRAQHMQEVIIPALRDNKIVISDRFTDSSLVYQGFGRSLPLEIITSINNWVINDYCADLIIYLHIDAKTARKRIQKRGITNAYDSQTTAFFNYLIKMYNQIYERKDNVILLDGTQPLSAVINDAISKINQCISNRQ